MTASTVDGILDRAGKDLNAMNKGSEADCIMWVHLPYIK